jgi:hypothetical protein
MPLPEFAKVCTPWQNFFAFLLELPAELGHCGADAAISLAGWLENQIAKAGRVRS